MRQHPSSSAASEVEAPEGRRRQQRVSSRGLPILRLAVDADTQTVRRLDRGETFVLRGRESTARVVQQQDHTEVFDSNEAGLSWGEKRANDGSWQERWMQQQTGEGEELFGRNSGYDASLQQRWSETWSRSKDRVETEKECEQIDEESGEEPRLLQRWVERTVEEGGRYKRVKEGWDYRGEEPRQWKEETAGRQEANSSPSVSGQREVKQTEVKQTEVKQTEVKQTEVKQTEVKQTEVKQTEVKQTEVKQTGGREKWLAGEVADIEESTETRGKQTRTNKTTKYSDGSVHVEVTYVDDEQRWTEERCDMADGSKWGNKRGVNQHGEKWNEKWLEYKDGEREVDKWAVNAQGDHLWGQKTNFSPDTSQETTEMWEKWISDTQLRISVDTCHVKPKSDGGIDKWGDRNLDTQAFMLDEAGKQKLQNAQVLQETWYDNASEYACDTTMTETAYDTRPDDTTLPPVVKQVKHNKKVGDRYSDGTKWSNERSETSRPDVSSKLALSSVYQDKWWKETSGNKWGDKLYEEYGSEGPTGGTSLECHEKWYDNGTEKQTDRWEIKADGSKEGEKWGERDCDGVSWREKWSTDVEGHRSVLDKSWTTNEDGQTQRWGEHRGQEGSRQWLNKWGGEESHDGSGGREWHNVWDADETGTTKTEDEGSEWRSWWWLDAITSN
eukprot:GHVS01080458.1.p1 GENE.GHVS01080458.1~~GHVS01080458.1.p1  ORF type:complete len:670 (-),score=127.01 GHVS01080458.1:193-2202(-)